MGQPIRVWTNHYRVALHKTGTIYHYDIKITPTVPRSMNRKIFQLVSACRQNVLLVFHQGYAYESGGLLPTNRGLCCRLSPKLETSVADEKSCLRMTVAPAFTLQCASKRMPSRCPSLVQARLSVVHLTPPTMVEQCMSHDLGYCET